MAYRKRTKYSKLLLSAMQAGKDRARMDRPAPERPPELPDLRRRIIVIDYDHGRVVHRIDLHKTRRVDCYRAIADGKEWKRSIGWAKVLEGVRKSFVRIGRFDG